MKQVTSHKQVHTLHHWKRNGNAATNIHFQIKHIYLRVYHREITKWIKQWEIGRRKFVFDEYQFGGGRGSEGGVSINKKIYKIHSTQHESGEWHLWKMDLPLFQRSNHSTGCCLFAPLLFFPGYFLQFFRQCHSQSSGVGTRGPGQRKQILITGIF